MKMKVDSFDSSIRKMIKNKELTRDELEEMFRMLNSKKREYEMLFEKMDAPEEKIPLTFFERVEKGWINGFVRLPERANLVAMNILLEDNEPDWKIRKRLAISKQEYERYLQKIEILKREEE